MKKIQSLGFKKYILTLLSLVGLIFAPITFAEASKDEIKAFNKKYLLFKAILDSDTELTQEIANQGKEVYELSKGIYGENDLNVAALAEFYLVAMDNQFNLDEYVDVADDVVKIYEKNGRISDAIHNIVKKGKFYKDVKTDNKKAFKTYQRAMEFANKYYKGKELAGFQLALGKLYVESANGNLGKVKKAKFLLQKAADHFENTNKAFFADASFWLGKIALSRHSNDSAIEHFTVASDVFSTLENKQRNEKVSRTFLIQALIEDGQDELASKQCLEVGKISSWDDNTEIEPLYILQPNYPRKALKKGKVGWVTMSFIVDLDGKAKDIKVVKRKGIEDFVATSKEAISKWRFAPKYVDSKPVEAEAFYTLEYTLAN